MLAEHRDMPGVMIEKDSRLIDEIGFDSLSIAELVVTLIVELEMTGLGDSLDKVSWTDLTAGELFEHYVTGTPVKPRAEHRIEL